MFLFFKIVVVLTLIITGVLFVSSPIVAQVEANRKKEKYEIIGAEGVFLAIGCVLIVTGLFLAFI